MMGAAGDDLVQPFQIERSSLRGRLVRLGGALDWVLARHAYPDAVAGLLGETVALTALLASGLKYDGVFSVQTTGNGAVPTMLADMTSAGNLRGYAKVAPERLPQDDGPTNPVPGLIGQGHLAFTVDQGPHTERYQGLVALTGATLSDCVRHYFRQSEQIDAGLRLALGRRRDAWRAGALMLQRLPDGAPAPLGSDQEDDWRRAMVLMESATDDELLDPELPPTDLLYRLFHEDGVRVFAPLSLSGRCRCSRTRVEGMLRSLPTDAIDDFAVDGALTVTCEFCNHVYRFDKADVATLLPQ